MKPLDSSVNQSTQVAFRILETMAEIGEPVELSVLARKLDIPKPRAFRFLRTLVAIGYVLQDQTNDRYRLSLKLFHLGQAVADQTDLLTQARPQMTQLMRRTGQTVTFAVPEADGMRVLDIVRAPSPVQIVTRPGSILDYHASAMGKVALAFGGPEGWAAIEQSGPAVDIARLRNRVETVRQCGWADAPGETLAGVNAISAPIFTSGRRFAATITVAGPLETLPSPPPQELIDAVCGTARAISASLGLMEAAE